MVRQKAKPHRETQHTIPVNTGPVPGKKMDCQESPDSETSSQRSTYSLEDVPLAQRIEQPAKRRKLHADGVPPAAQRQQQHATQITWHACKCCSDEQADDFFPLKSVPLAISSSPPGAPAHGSQQQTKIFAKSCERDSIMQQLLVQLPHCQLEGAISLPDVAMHKNLSAELRQQRVACMAKQLSGQWILQLGLMRHTLSQGAQPQASLDNLGHRAVLQNLQKLLMDNVMYSLRYVVTLT